MPPTERVPGDKQTAGTRRIQSPLATSTAAAAAAAAFLIIHREMQVAISHSENDDDNRHRDGRRERGKGYKGKTVANSGALLEAQRGRGREI